jgi:hypothetical protein
MRGTKKHNPFRFGFLSDFFLRWLIRVWAVFRFIKLGVVLVRKTSFFSPPFHDATFWYMLSLR